MTVYGSGIIAPPRRGGFGDETLDFYNQFLVIGYQALCFAVAGHGEYHIDLLFDYV